MDAFRTIDKVKSAGCQMGVVLNPATPLSAVSYYLNHIDLLTIMTVDVGYSGGKFVPEMLEKIREAVRIREERGLHYVIQVDGACNAANFKAMDEAGAEEWNGRRAERRREQGAVRRRMDGVTGKEKQR